MYIHTTPSHFLPGKKYLVNGTEIDLSKHYKTEHAFASEIYELYVDLEVHDTDDVSSDPLGYPLHMQVLVGAIYCDGNDIRGRILSGSRLKTYDSNPTLYEGVVETILCSQNNYYHFTEVCHSSRT